MENTSREKEISKEELITTLIEAYWVTVKKLAFTYVNDWGVAEDITQDVFIKCYKNLNLFRRDSSYKTWLYKVTVNRCKDEFRGKWFKSLRIFEEVKDKVGKKELSAEQSFINQNKDKELSELVLALPIKYREVIILYYYEDLKIEEIQYLLGLNISTIKTRLRRGKTLLKSRIERSAI